MLDEQVSQPVRVLNDAPGRPYLIVPAVQLAEVRELLERYRWPHAVEGNEPGVAAVVVALGDGVDAGAVQSALDAIP